MLRVELNNADEPRVYIPVIFVSLRPSPLPCPVNPAVGVNFSSAESRQDILPWKETAIVGKQAVCRGNNAREVSAEWSGDRVNEGTQASRLLAEGKKASARGIETRMVFNADSGPP